MKLHPQEVSQYTVDLVEENAAGVVGMELDCGLFNKTTKEHVPAEVARPLPSKEVPTSLIGTYGWGLDGARCRQ